MSGVTKTSEGELLSVIHDSMTKEADMSRGKGTILLLSSSSAVLILYFMLFLSATTEAAVQRLSFSSESGLLRFHLQLPYMRSWCLSV